MMKKYKVTVTPDARQDLKNAVQYIKVKLHNPVAAKSLMDDYIVTRKRLSQMAGSIRDADADSICGRRNLKRINFARHNYFMLFLVDGDEAVVTNIFHDREDYDHKLW